MRNVFRLWMLLCACAVGAQDAALVNTNGALVFPTNFLSANGIAPLASPALSGNPTAPTETAGDNDTSISTTAFVTAAIEALKALQLWQDTNAVLTTLAALTGGNSSNFFRGDGSFSQDGQNWTNLKGSAITGPITNRPSVRLVVIGDSRSSPAYSSWAYWINARSNINGITILTNAAYGGASFVGSGGTNITQSQFASVLPYAPTNTGLPAVLAVWGGINNRNDSTVDELWAGVTNVTASARAAGFDVMFFTDTFYYASHVTVWDKFEEFNRRIRSWGTNFYRLVDCGAMLGNPKDGDWIFNDGLHLDDKIDYELALYVEWLLMQGAAYRTVWSPGWEDRARTAQSTMTNLTTVNRLISDDVRADILLTENLLPRTTVIGNSYFDKQVGITGIEGWALHTGTSLDYTNTGFSGGGMRISSTTTNMRVYMAPGAVIRTNSPHDFYCNFKVETGAVANITVWLGTSYLDNNIRSVTTAVVGTNWSSVTFPFTNLTTTEALHVFITADSTNGGVVVYDNIVAAPRSNIVVVGDMRTTGALRPDDGVRAATSTIQQGTIPDLVTYGVRVNELHPPGNIVTNATFDSTINGWVYNYGTPTWTSNGLAGGAMLLTQNDATLNRVYANGGFPTSTNTVYDFGVWSKRLNSQGSYSIRLGTNVLGSQVRTVTNAYSGDDWQFDTFSFTNTLSTTTHVLLFSNHTNTSAVLFDNVTIRPRTNIVAMGNFVLSGTSSAQAFSGTTFSGTTATWTSNATVGAGMVLLGTNTVVAPGVLTVMGAHLWTDGTNLCVVLQNAAGTRTTNKLSMTGWP